MTGEGEETSLVAEAAQDGAELLPLDSDRVLEVARRQGLLRCGQDPLSEPFVVVRQKPSAFNERRAWAGDGRTALKTEAA